MKTVDCFHAASLADLWDRLENGETRRAEGSRHEFTLPMEN